MKNTKKILSIALAGALAFGSMGAVFAAVPTDVKGTAVESSVTRLGTLEILKGYEDGTFKADKTITRAEFAAVVVRALGYESAAKAAMGPTKFADVAKENWAAGYINVASSLKFINGVSETSFAPDAPVKYEEAVAMVVRALGYEPAAKAKGGYPAGYIVVAGESKLNKDLAGAFGMPAPRGAVAKLIDNALETPMMIQVGYGDQSKFVVSGTEGTTAQSLLGNKLEVKTLEDVVMSVNKTDKTITVGTKVLKVADGFNYEGVVGAKIKTYAKDDKLVSYTVSDSVMFDAAKVDAANKEVKLIGADKTYKVDSSLTVAAATYDYAKVVLRDSKVVKITGLNFNGNVVAEKVQGDVVIGHGEEISLKDYAIVKDGVEIKVADIKAGDVVFYNVSSKFAEVYNKAVTGKVDEMYSDAVRIAGKDYAISGAMYFDKDGKKSSADLVTKIKDLKGKDLTVNLDRKGNVLIAKVDASVTTSKVVGFLKGSVSAYNYKGKNTYGFDLVNAEGKVVSYEAIMADTTVTNITLPTAGNSMVVNGMVELTLDKDAKITAIKVLDKTDVTSTALKASDSYYAGKKLSGDVVVFDIEKYTTDAKDIKISTIAKPGFDRVVTGSVYYDADGYVKYILARDAEGATNDATATKVVVTEIKQLAGETEYRVKALVGSEEKTLYTDLKGAKTLAELNALVATAVTFDIDKVSGKITKVTSLVANTDTMALPASYKALIASKQITDASGTVMYRLTSDAKVYNVDASNVVTEKSLADVTFTNAMVVLDAPGSSFVKFVIYK